MAKKANHHFIPQFYLRNFSNGFKRQARLFTFDSETKTSFTTHVRNVGSRRDYNRIVADGVDPDIVKDAYAEIDSVISEHLKEVIEAGRFISSEHFTSIMNLIAIASIRNPRFRDNLSGFQKEIAQRIMELATASEEIWLSQIRQMKKDGYPINENVTYQEMKEFYDRGEYDIIIDRNYLIGMEIEMTQPVLEKLVERNWCFVTAPDGCDFITSDDPAVLKWREEKDKTLFSPGHGLKNTQVSFPLSPSLLLIGEFEEIPSYYNFTPEEVAAANTTTAKYSGKQIYARNGNFRLHIGHHKNISGNDLSRLYINS